MVHRGRFGFLLPQPQMCYVPKRGEGETNVLGKFVDDGSAVHKNRGIPWILQFWAMKQTQGNDRHLGIGNIKMIVDIL